MIKSRMFKCEGRSNRIMEGVALFKVAGSTGGKHI